MDRRSVLKGLCGLGAVASGVATAAGTSSAESKAVMPVGEFKAWQSRAKARFSEAFEEAWKPSAHKLLAHYDTRLLLDGIVQFWPATSVSGGMPLNVLSTYREGRYRDCRDAERGFETLGWDMGSLKRNGIDEAFRQHGGKVVYFNYNGPVVRQCCHYTNRGFWFRDKENGVVDVSRLTWKCELRAFILSPEDAGECRAQNLINDGMTKRPGKFALMDRWAYRAQHEQAAAELGLSWKYPVGYH